MDIGNKIVILNAGTNSCFKKGDIATLTEKDKDGDWWADFNGNDEVDDDGIWCIDECNSKYELVR